MPGTGTRYKAVGKIGMGPVLKESSPVRKTDIKAKITKIIIKVLLCNYNHYE